jgi:preprotein translocase subunit YajC
MVKERKGAAEVAVEEEAEERTEQQRRRHRRQQRHQQQQEEVEEVEVVVAAAAVAAEVVVVEEVVEVVEHLMIREEMAQVETTRAGIIRRDFPLKELTRKDTNGVISYRGSFHQGGGCIRWPSV